MRWFEFAGFIAATAVGLMVADASFAEPPFGKPHRGPEPEGFIEEHAEELGLDSETQAAIEQIIDESRDQARGVHGEVRELRRAMHELLEQQNPDEAAVMQQAEAIGAAETELHKQRLEALIKIRALLTSEQREKLVRIRENSWARWVQPLIDACEGDVERFCGGSPEGRLRRRCLRDHYDEVSPDCQDAIESAKGA
jgi:Spy/CpxP family protein refolding chaperone